jgi:tRNA pseudouridine55 synthase
MPMMATTRMNERPAAGFLPVDKPAGPTSHDVVAVARRTLRERRIGHTGTLDPFASGLLLLAIGRATRLAEYMSDLAKSYAATMRLGIVTDTDDRTGSTVATSDEWRALEPDGIRAALESLVGEIRQVPPMYSARKVGGRRLYALARDGIEVEREATPATIHSVEVTRIDGPIVAFEITCSTGTNIRSIARDTGNELGCGAHLVELRRTAIGPHRVENAVPLDDLEDAALVRRAWITPARALDHLPAVAIDADQARSLSLGRAITVPPGTCAGVAAALDHGELVAVGEVVGDALRPRKVFG